MEVLRDLFFRCDLDYNRDKFVWWPCNLRHATMRFIWIDQDMGTLVQSGLNFTSQNRSSWFLHHFPAIFYPLVTLVHSITQNKMFFGCSNGQAASVIRFSHFSSSFEHLDCWAIFNWCRWFWGKTSTISKHQPHRGSKIGGGSCSGDNFGIGKQKLPEVFAQKLLLWRSFVRSDWHIKGVAPMNQRHARKVCENSPRISTLWELQTWARFLFGHEWLRPTRIDCWHFTA